MLSQLYLQHDLSIETEQRMLKTELLQVELLQIVADIFIVSAPQKFYQRLNKYISAI